MSLDALSWHEMNQYQWDCYQYCAAIDACGKASIWTEALELLCGMAQRTVQIDRATFTASISACGKGGEWKEALQNMNVMISHNVQSLAHRSRAIRNENENGKKKNVNEHIETKTKGWSQLVARLRCAKVSTPF